MKARIIAISIGSAALLTPECLMLAVPSRLPWYHHHLPATVVAARVLVDLLICSAAIAGLLFAIELLAGKLRQVAWALVAALSIWRLLDLGLSPRFWAQPSSAMLYWQAHRSVSCLSMVALFVGGALTMPGASETATGTVRTIVAAFSFVLLWAVPSVLWFALNRHFEPDSNFGYVVPTPPNAPARRIVWILFDELSYDQTFEHRRNDVPLPSFDRLRAASVSFSDLKPAGFYTDRIVPALFLGRRIETIRSTPTGKLQFKEQAKSSWEAFDPDATLFAIAQQAGWKSGVSGWLNPYCRILRPVLDSCTWRGQPILRAESQRGWVVADVRSLEERLLAKYDGQNLEARNLEIEDYRNLLDSATQLIASPQVQFVFIHLSVPHPLGIYDRRLHSLRLGGSYLDNLVLADDTFGELWKRIDETSSAGQTTLIVSSDHSWRTPLWRGQPEWTAEEESASRGRFDDRPVFLVHFPGKTEPEEIKAPTSELLEHDIVAAMLQNKISTVSDLNAFLSSRNR